MKDIGCAQDATGRLWSHPEVYFYLTKTRQRTLFVLCLAKYLITTYVIIAERKLQTLTTIPGIVLKSVRKRILVVVQCQSIKKFLEEKSSL